MAIEHSPPTLFDRTLRKKRRERCQNAKQHPLYDQAILRLEELFEETLTQHFPTALELGSRAQSLKPKIMQQAGIQHYIQAELSATYHPDLVLDDEYLPFGESSLDLIISMLNLHHVNDVPGHLIQCRNALKAKGLYVAMFLGGQSLHELRDVLLQVEADEGMAPRISPMIDVKDGGMLLSRAQFQLPVADSETLTLLYPSAFALMHDLRAMGETNILTARHTKMPQKDFFNRVDRCYKERYQDAEGFIPATFELITLTGWRS